MKILGVEDRDYIDVCKKPLLVYLVLAVMNTILSFISFEMYTYTAAVSFFVYFGLPIYVGWIAPQKGMGGSRAILAGVIYGACFGFVQGIVSSLLLTQNHAYAENFYALINVTNSTGADAFTVPETVNNYMLSSLLLGPIFFGLLFGIMAGVAGLVAKFLGKEKRAENDWSPIESEEKAEPPRSKPKPSKKFRRKR